MATEYRYRVCHCTCGRCGAPPYWPPPYWPPPYWPPPYYVYPHYYQPQITSTTTEADNGGSV